MPRRSEKTASDHQANDGTSAGHASDSDRRRFRRLTTLMNGRLFFAAKGTDGVVLDVSINGVKFRTDDNLPLGAPVTLSLAGSVHFGGEVAWRQGNILGVRFSKSPERVAEALSAMMPLQYLQRAAA